MFTLDFSRFSETITPFSAVISLFLPIKAKIFAPANGKLILGRFNQSRCAFLLVVPKTQAGAQAIFPMLCFNHILIFLPGFRFFFPFSFFRSFFPLHFPLSILYLRSLSLLYLSFYISFPWPSSSLFMFGFSLCSLIRIGHANVFPHFRQIGRDTSHEVGGFN